MVFMRSSIRNMALFNNTLVEVSHDEEINNLDNLDNFYNFNEPDELQEELLDELQDELLDELQDELQDELNNNQTTLFIVTLRGTSFYFLNQEIIPIKKVISEKQFDNFTKNSDTLSCPICMEDSDDNIILPCNHNFCSACIKKWLLKKTDTCPICRKSVVA